MAWWCPLGSLAGAKSKSVGNETWNEATRGPLKAFKGWWMVHRGHSEMNHKGWLMVYRGHSEMRE